MSKKSGYHPGDVDISRNSVIKFGLITLLLLTTLVLSILFLGWHMYMAFGISVIWLTFYSRVRFIWSEIFHAAAKGLLSVWRPCAVLLVIGVLIPLWIQTGSISSLMHFSSEVLMFHYTIVLTFIVSSVLSMVIGSSTATWGILGPPLLSSVPHSMVPLIAGALLSGGMVGDRTSPLSTSVVMMSKTVELPYHTTLRLLNRSVLLPTCLTLIIFLVMDRVVPQSMGMNLVSPLPVSLISLIPPALVILLAVMRVGLLINLLTNVALSFCLSVWESHFSFFELWYGGHLVHADHVANIGGITPMFSVILVIVFAGAFRGLLILGGYLESAMTRLFSFVSHPLLVALMSFSVSIMTATIMGSQLVAISMSGEGLLSQFRKKGLGNEAALRMISNSTVLVACIIPWNALCLQALTVLNVSYWTLVPYACFIYVAMTWAFVALWLDLRAQ